MSQSRFAKLLDEQIAHEFSASQQYIAIAVWYDGDALPQLAGHFYRQAIEERNHAMMIVQYLMDADLPVTIPGIQGVKNDFANIAEPVALALDQERRVSAQIAALAAAAREDGDFMGEQFMQWFLKEQVEEVASMTTLLRVVERAADNALQVEEYLSRENASEGCRSDRATCSGRRALRPFAYCPRCGTAYPGPPEGVRQTCRACGESTYVSPKPAACGVVVDGRGRTLLGRRAGAPRAGLWDVLGGFLEPGESPEQGLERELLEEIGVHCTVGRYLGGFVDTYSEAGSGRRRHAQPRLRVPPRRGRAASSRRRLRARVVRAVRAARCRGLRVPEQRRDPRRLARDDLVAGH